jgi:hypothetical protein
MQPAVPNRLAKHPRFHDHFTPTSAAVAEHVGAPLPRHHDRTRAPGRVDQRARDILQKVIRPDGRLGFKQNEALH